MPTEAKLREAAKRVLELEARLDEAGSIMEEETLAFETADYAPMLARAWLADHPEQDECT